MAIDRIDGGSGGPRQAEKPDRAEKPEAKAARRGEVREAESRGTDRIELSEEARRVARLAAKVAALPEIRQERVDALRKALARGTYEVDPRELARAIVEFEDDLAR